LRNPAIALNGRSDFSPPPGARRVAREGEDDEGGEQKAHRPPASSRCTSRARHRITAIRPANAAPAGTARTAGRDQEIERNLIRNWNDLAYPAPSKNKGGQPMRDFEDKVIVVTGSATGLGAAIALGAAKRGAKAVIVNYTKSLKEAEATADAVRAAGAEATIARGDVGEDADCRKIAEAASRYGKIDALVNNAGITKHVANHADLDGLSKDDFLRIFAINTVGPFQVVRACRALLEKAGAASVLMTSSIAGVTGIGSSVAYAASKGALNTMTLSLARALAPKIRVNAICPGYIDTRWFTDAFGEQVTAGIRENVVKATPLKAASKAEDVADAALFLISDAARHVTGETLLVDAGLHLGYAPLVAR
jgi:NAD(P)-dependent dehydrogenase (short-subunit alcohol dehydrogenase family)